MTIIVNNKYRQDFIGTLKNLPTQVLSKLNISTTYLNQSSNNLIEVVIISGESVDKVRQTVDNLGGTYEDLGYSFGLVKIPVDKVVDLSLDPQIQYIELPKSLYITDSQANRASCVQTAQGAYNLLGEGTLVGFIDTGIDYTHPAFINDDRSTRIEYIYDLDGDGKIYNKTMINEALASDNPLSIVPSNDIVGHGTHVAGIACAGGRIDPRYYGVAPKSSIAMVKVTRTQFSLSTLIMRGLKFLVDRAKELQMPLVVNISLSTNDGAHNGSSLLEQYIQTVASLEKITIVIAGGNEGEAAHHVGGNIKLENKIDFNVARDETMVSINLYKSVLPQLTLELISPDGKSSGIIDVVEGFNSGVVGSTRYDIYNTGPKPFDISGEIGIVLRGLIGFITSGQWTIVLRRVNDYEGIFDMWLPISEGLNVSTKFLNPTIYNTLGIPATVKNVISVGSYNFLTNTISPFSGRGKLYNGGEIKPDVVAPGENIESAIPNRSFGPKTGTSMATPNVTGICALMTEWGIVKRNDPYLYGERLRYYLLIGAKRGRRDVLYPDPAWGYGEVCAYDSLSLVTEVVNSLVRNKSASEEFIRQQDEISTNNVNTESSNTNTINNEAEIGNVSLAPSTTVGTNDDIFILVESPTEEAFKKALQIKDIRGLLISETFGILIIPENKITDIEDLGLTVVDIETNTILTLSQISPLSAAKIDTIRENPYLRLNGRGVLVGILDTGIDYLNEEFMREDDTSRIFRIWDQTIQGDKYIYDLNYGTEYTEEQITEAIKLKKNGGNPYSIVGTTDTIGHGTAMASIIGARGINPDLKGAAPDCEFVIVKLVPANKSELERAYVDTNVPSYTPWSILLGIRYIGSVAKAANRPVVIYIPLGTNMGSHSGNGIIESSIYNYSGRIGTVIITPTGNQGNTETHTEGEIEKTGDYKDIQIRVGANQKRLPIEIWINQPNRVILSIISPSGEIISDLTSKNTNREKIKFTYEGTEMIVNFTNPEQTTGDGLISIKASNLREGIWRFRLTGEYIVNGNYYAWIPQRELLDESTRFLTPVEDTTLTLPSTARGAISVAYYNQNNNSVVGESGRGYTRDGRIKPEIAAGGINASVTKPGGGIASISGASVAGAVVAGGCALILQWAIVDGNDPTLYANQIRSYIISGATGRVGDIYPNREWGYGMFDLEKVFNVIRDVYSPKFATNTNRYDEYRVEDLFIRRPK
ncbi:PII-type proteinase precursor [uncultured Clostridium sp.]|uniref:S8 family serine peptidase n=1 Tax=uncultured Clostridium sp. TaxID=59620 RepID=UPI000822564A|nr:S8 family serine peptidase [uncultured Clostridium sp.]SCJ94798.1 PII-type proteinase precursor [uncultured Clostridium sp.]